MISFKDLYGCVSAGEPDSAVFPQTPVGGPESANGDRSRMRGVAWLAEGMEPRLSCICC
jgi:hypothetical protein